jgi:hypothetical protein
MKIEIPNRLPKNKSTHYTEKKMRIKSKLIFFVLCLSLLSFIIGLCIPSSKEVIVRVNNWAVKHGHNALRHDILLRYALLKLPVRVFQSFIPSNHNLSKIYIDIKYKNIQKINQKRMKALSDGILLQGPDDFVPATIRYNNRSIKAKLRLKGDWIDHLEGRKWSFRIHIKGEDQLFGMRRFSIQHPKVRGFYGEPLFMETLRHVGVLSLRYFFIDVVINGDDLGIMAIEEHFSKELLEFNDRREGVIVCYDESLLWRARGLMGGHEHADPIFSSYKNTAVDSFRSSHIAKSPALTENLAIAVGLLRSFTSGDLRASEVFDIELMGRFLAVLEFLGSCHAMWWHNLRFYLNPITLRLEPIGFDSDLQSRYKSSKTISQLAPPLITAILNDSKIFDVYHKTVLKLSKEVLDGSLIDKLQKVQNQYIKDLRKEFYLLEPFPFDELKKRALFFQSIDKNSLKEPVSYPKLLHAFLTEDKEGSHLEILNAVPHDISILSINWIAIKDPNSTRDFHTESGLQFPITIPATPPGELPITHTISYEYNENPNNFSLIILASIKGGYKHYKHVAHHYFVPLKAYPIPISTPTEQLFLHPFLTIDEADKKLCIKQGLWEVKNSIVVPASYDLVVSEGTTLTISKGKGIFACGGLIFKGTVENPIKIRGTLSADGKSSETWQGIFVQNSQRLSEWSHVTIRDTKSINYLGWNLTGGVNFYKSDVHLSDCVFKNSYGEDALNIINSEFLIVNTDFVSTMSDAFDADFSIGNIEGGIFQDIGKSGGGDAIDISGSKVSVLGSFFENVNDKALSVGERSTMSVKNIHVRNAGTGAVSKDGSLLEIKDSYINQAVHAGLMAYIKKQEFGPARIVANNIKYSGSAAFARAEKGSEITVDGKKIGPQDMDVKKMYDTIMRPGNRK